MNMFMFPLDDYQAALDAMVEENGQKAFFQDWCITIREACINDQVYFQKYSYYDLIINYKKIFRL